MHIAREELVLAATRLRERKAGQVKSLTSLEEDRGELRDGAEALSERYEDVKDKGDELRLRVESVLAKLQESGGRVTKYVFGVERVSAHERVWFCACVCGSARPSMAVWLSWCHQAVAGYASPAG